MSTLAVSTPRVLRTVVLVAALAVGGSALLAPASARAEASAEFYEKYTAFANAFKAKNYAEAYKAAKEASAVAKSGEEKLAALKMTYNATAATSKFAEEADALEQLIASPAVGAGEKPAYHRALGGLYAQLNKLDKALTETKECQKTSCTQADWDLLAQLYAAVKDCPNALQALDKSLAGKPANVNQLKVQQSCYYKKDNAKYLAVSEDMLHRFPSKLAYTQVLRAYQEKKLDELAMLAVLRYGFDHDWLDDEADYLKYTDYALDVGATAEAQRVIESGLKKKVVKATDKASNLGKQAKDRAAEDAKTLAQADAEARAGKNGEADVHLGLRYFSVGQYDKAVEAINRGLSADRVARVKRPDDAKMVLGIALTHLKKKADADKAFGDAKADPRMTEAARVWLGA